MNTVGIKTKACMVFIYIYKSLQLKRDIYECQQIDE